MKRNINKLASRRLRSSQQRRSMLKKLHQKVMQRRKSFQSVELSEKLHNKTETDQTNELSCTITSTTGYAC